MSSETENTAPPLNVEKCSLVLVDVAGTTTSIDFVKDTLFPFALDKVEAFLATNWEQDSVKESLKKLQDQEEPLDQAKAVELVKKLTGEDSANEGLKTLQGLIYKEGYEKGDLKAHVFADVAEAFETWAKTRKIAIYSTGSVDSQKLLFAHTILGDLSEHISNYFDQKVGKKTEAESYKKIAEEAKTPPEEIVFITDDAAEATAAKAGGLHAVLIKRDGNPDLPEDLVKDFVVVNSFAELILDKTSKRKIEEGPMNVEAPPSKHAKTEEEESMEVDSKPPETATEETENLVKPEKTEDAEMKEVEKTEPEAETVIEVTVEEIEPTAELPPVDLEPVVEEAEKEEEPKKVEEEETKPAEEIVVEEVEKEEPEAVVANIEPVVEEPKAEEEKKVEEAVMAEPEEAQPDVEMSEEKVEEAEMKNGEEGESSKPKAEEKENKSVLANGVENGNKDESEVDNGTEVETATTNADNVDNKDDDNSEVKVKKLEESAESKTVSVEV